jgi:transcriptional regulator with XRE-family HTH domain
MLAHPKILKLARLALDLTQEEVAALAGVSLRILQKLEAYDQDTTIRTVRLVQQALEEQGVKFLGDTESLGSGFRIRTDHLRKTWGDQRTRTTEGNSDHSV